MNKKLEYRALGYITEEDTPGVISGVAMKYNTVASDRREIFMPGAFQGSEEIILNLQHNRSAPIARTSSEEAPLVLTDSPTQLEMRAKPLQSVQNGREAVEMVRAKILQGLSVEFRAVKESYKNGVRIIEKAVLFGIGLVDTPSYPGATVEARAKKPGIILADNSIQLAPNQKLIARLKKGKTWL